MTGGAGYIGSHAVRELLESGGCKIVQPDLMHAGGLTEVSNLHALCRWHHQYKHRHDLRLVGEGTDQRFIPAAEWIPPDADRRRRRCPEPLAAA